MQHDVGGRHKERGWPQMERNKPVLGKAGFRRCAAFLSAEKEMYSLFFLFVSFISSINNLDTSNIPWKERLSPWIKFSSSLMGESELSCYFKVRNCFFFFCQEMEIWVPLWGILLLWYILHICKSTCLKLCGRFFYTEEHSILSGNTNGCLWLSQHFLKTLSAFIFLVENGKGVRKMIFFLYVNFIFRIICVFELFFCGKFYISVSIY